MISALTSINILSILGIFAFLTNVVVELVKNLKGIKQIPTQLVAIIVAMVLMLASSAMYIQYTHIAFDMSCILMPIIASFPVAYISMYGFDTFKNLYNRFNIKG